MRSNDNDSDVDIDMDRVVNAIAGGGWYSNVELALHASKRLKQLHFNMFITLVHRGDEILLYVMEYNRKTGILIKKAGVTFKLYLCYW